MKKRMLFFALLFLIFIIGCAEEPEYLTCPDNVTQVLDLTECPASVKRCPESCDDGNNCTIDSCGPLSDYECEHEEAFPCDGNAICEEGEFPWSDDCIDSCDDGDACTQDTYNYELGGCLYEPIVPCCGNGACEAGETYLTCDADCKQVLDIWVTGYVKRKRLEGSYIDIADEELVFVVVYFKIHNKGIDREETFNYQKLKGFYYDPFKMRLEDPSRQFYDPEYDSDLLLEFLDTTVIPKGDTVGAAMVFVVPIDVEHVRLVAYDRYGSKLDIAEVY
jgi:hypothetical protein